MCDDDCRISCKRERIRNHGSLVGFTLQAADGYFLKVYSLHIDFLPQCYFHSSTLCIVASSSGERKHPVALCRKHALYPDCSFYWLIGFNPGKVAADGDVY